MSAEPWYRTTLRWAQTNLVECDPARYDTEWWREHWRKTRIQGVIVNAGGIVAYYPSRFPLHHRAEKLGERDLYGEIVAAAREEGLAVARPHGLEPSRPGLLRSAPRLDLPRHRRRADPPGRQVRHLHRLALLQRVPAGRDARDHRAQPSGRLHRQQLAGPAAQPASATATTARRSSRPTPARSCRRRTTGTPTPTATGCAGTSSAGPTSGSSTTRSPARPAASTAPGWG